MFKENQEGTGNYVYLLSNVSLRDVKKWVSYEWLWFLREPFPNIQLLNDAVYC